MELIKETRPVARKEHYCMLCQCKIEKGQQYVRQTCSDGYMYDFINHTECSEIASRLGMYDNADDGLQDDEFQVAVDEYIYHNHYDDVIDDIEVEWQKLSLYEKVVKIIDELNRIESEPTPDFHKCVHYCGTSDIPCRHQMSCRFNFRQCRIQSGADKYCYYFRKKTDKDNA